MSYCRWSTDDYQCDVYVWHDITDTWRTEVAGRRRIWKVPLPPPVHGEIGSDEWLTSFTDRHTALMRLLNDESNFDWQTIAEPDGGRSYTHDSPGECADNLQRLHEAGLNVPQDAIDTLREEHQELAGGP